jgi:hypothetical protein
VNIDAEFVYAVIIGPRREVKPISRTEAISIGLLVEADPQLCKHVGIHLPVALTGDAWRDCVAPSYRDGERLGVAQDDWERLYDVLKAARHAIADAAQPGSPDHAPFTVRCTDRAGSTCHRKPVRLTVTATHGTDGCVITIGQPQRG